MTEHRGTMMELTDAIEALTATIAMNEREDEFFRRLSKASTQPSIKALLLEVAEELGACRHKLESGRERLLRIAARTK